MVTWWWWWYVRIMAGCVYSGEDGGERWLVVMVVMVTVDRGGGRCGW